MPARCQIADDDPPAPSGSAAAASGGAAVTSDDSSPHARTRGGYRGFLPPGVADDLRASAASGSGLALSAPAVPVRRDGLLLGLALVSLFLAFRNSRKS